MHFAPLNRNLARVWVPPTAVVSPSVLAEVVRAIPAEDLALRGIMELPLAGGGADFFPKAALHSAAGSWVLGVGSTSLDLMNVRTLEQEPLNLADFVAVARGVFRAALGDDGFATRVAVVREGYLGADAIDGPAVGVRLLAPPAPFNADLWEWDWRVVTSVDRQVADYAFDTNTIATLRYAGVQILPETESKGRLRVDLDINTAQSEQARFSSGQVDAFLTGVVAWQHELERTIGRHIGVNDV